MTTAPHTNKPQLQVFGSLRAEYEVDWLPQVFVRSIDFYRLAELRSFIIYGESGTGKTALKLALCNWNQQSAATGTAFIVEWQPLPPSADYTGNSIVQACITQLFDAWAAAMLTTLSQNPTLFSTAPRWTQESLRWFVQRYLGGDHEMLLDRMSEQAQPAGQAVLHTLLTEPARQILREDGNEFRVITEVVRALQRLGFSGVCVMIDQLDSWLETRPDAVTQMLWALLSTLGLFENPHFVFKVFAPIALEPALSSSGGIDRRRLEVQRLQWTPVQLTHLLEHRLAVAVGKELFSMEELAPADMLTPWLMRYGGSTPRGWLDLARPFVEQYLMRHTTRPLTSAECTEILKTFPPKLWLDLKLDRVFVGYSEIQEMQPTAYRILRYLYEHRPQLCTREELYYRACKELTYEPLTHQDPGWEDSVVWDGLFDSAIYRLRQAIEPNPKRPRYIITRRGKGIYLQHT